MPPTKAPTKSVLLRQANAFDRAYPIGTPVIVDDLDGLPSRTIVWRAAYYRDGQIVCACRHIPGLIAIDRVRPVEDTA